MPLSPNPYEHSELTSEKVDSLKRLLDFVQNIFRFLTALTATLVTVGVFTKAPAEMVGVAFGLMVMCYFLSRD